MEWFEERPETHGLYLMRKLGEWPVRLVRVKKGDWKLRQDPSQLYADAELLSNVGARWLGPLPDPPESFGGIAEYQDEEFNI